MTQWRDKAVLVTGGSSGLGFAIARAFATAGARVAIAARDREKLAAAATQLKQSGGEVVAFPADVGNDEQTAQLIADVVSRFGRLDVLVNNVGVSARGAAVEITPSDIHSLIESNVGSAVRCTRAAAAHLIASGGHIVNIGSLASKSAARYLGAYPASKFALAAYTQQLRLELADQGVHVLLVCPGPLARRDAGQRYRESSAGLPASAQRPGGGVRLRGLDPAAVAERIVRACQRRQGELVVPAKARLLFALAQLSSSLGDWLVRRMT
jgi:short-subunit dehydrogenase